MRWHHFFILGCILTAGAVLRFHLITKNNLWLDEYWAVYLATGRESGAAPSVIHAAHNVLFDPPLATGYSGAPAWWHIWTGLSSGAHPPLFYLVLRGWIDLFGDSDFSTRLLSTVLSLAGVAALFDIMRRYRGLASAFLAAGMMSFAVCQTDFSQQVRPYTLIPLLTILDVGAMLEIETKGQNSWRLAKLGLFTLLLALTHFLALGGIGGMGLYALIRPRKNVRRNVVLILIAALAIFAIIWGPSAWAARHTIESATVFAPKTTYKEIPYFLLIAPQRLLLGPFYWENTPWPIVIFLAFLVYVMPWVNRKNPGDLLWWFWIVASLGLVALLDWHAGKSRPPMLALDRYSMMVSPAVYALVSVPAASLLRGRWLGAAALVAGGYVLEKPYDWLARSSPVMIHLYDKPWLPLILCIALAIELAIILQIRQKAPGRAWAWIWAAGAIVFMMMFAAFDKKIPYDDVPNIISIAGVALLLGATMPALNDMRWLAATVLLVCTAVDAGERFRNGPAEQVDVRDGALAVDRNVPENEPIVFVNSGPVGPAFDYIAFAHYAPNSKRPIMLVSDSIPPDKLLALSGRRRIWIVGGPNGAEPVTATSRPGGE